MVTYVVIADTITIFFYLTFKQWLTITGIATNHYALLVGFCITTSLLFSNLCIIKHVTQPLSYAKACLLGLVQGIAFFPGISRFASTYTIARWLGLNHRRALETSFLLFTPFIIVAIVGNGIPGFIHWDHHFITLELLGTVILAGLISYETFIIVDKIGKLGYMWWFGCYMFLPLITLILSLFFR
jgi:undecaprenyl pyrophosphate phosphatase UppP